MTVAAEVCDHLPHPDPRFPCSCVKCGRPLRDDRPRDHALERELSELAARAAGLTRIDGNGRPVGDTAGLDHFADVRAHPGGVRHDLDPDREAREELADCRNYLLWGIEPIYAAHLAGDVDATEDVRRRLRALSHVVEAWHALNS